MWRGLVQRALAVQRGCGPLARRSGAVWRRTLSATTGDGVSSHSKENYEELVRYARQIRAESNIETIDDPPVAPLPEEHEVGPGESDFCNYLDDHSDTSNRQIIQGLGIAGGLLACVAVVSAYRYRHSERPIEPRTVPFWDKEIFGLERKEPATHDDKLAEAVTTSSGSDSRSAGVPASPASTMVTSIPMRSSSRQES